MISKDKHTQRYRFSEYTDRGRNPHCFTYWDNEKDESAGEMAVLEILNSHDTLVQQIDDLKGALKSYKEVFDDSTCKILEATLGDKFMVWLQGVLNEIEAALAQCKEKE